MCQDMVKRVIAGYHLRIIFKKTQIEKIGLYLLSLNILLEDVKYEMFTQFKIV